MKYSPDVRLPRTQVVPLLIDDYGWYIASESSFFRVLSEHNENHCRSTRHSGRVGPPRRHEAAKPCLLLERDLSEFNDPGSVPLSVLHA